MLVLLTLKCEKSIPFNQCFFRDEEFNSCTTSINSVILQLHI